MMKMCPNLASYLWFMSASSYKKLDSIRQEQAVNDADCWSVAAPLINARNAFAHISL